MSQWHPHSTVATDVERDGLFLIVEEMIEGRILYNQPAGHLEANETLQQGALRETLEETAWDVRLTSLLGLYHYTTADGTCYIRTCFVAEPVQHHPDKALDTGVLRALWMSRAELEARKDQLRSQIVLRVIDDYLAGNRHPLALITSLA